MEMKHQRGLRLVRVEVGGIARVFRPDRIVQLEDVDQPDLEPAQVREAQLIDRDSRRRVVSEVRVDEDQPLPPGRHRPRGDVAQGGDQRFVAQREGPGPLRGMALGGRVAQSRQHRHARSRRSRMADRLRQQRVHRHRQVRPVLLGGTERQQQQAAVLPAKFRDPGPGEVLEQDGLHRRVRKAAHRYRSPTG
jgi:hypothetical protein